MEPEKIEVSGIEYQVKGLIEFSSLARLLFDLAKRQKNLEDKYKIMNDSIIDKDKRISELEYKLKQERPIIQKIYKPQEPEPPLQSSKEVTETKIEPIKNENENILEKTHSSNLIKEESKISISEPKKESELKSEHKSEGSRSGQDINITNINKDNTTEINNQNKKDDSREQQNIEPVITHKEGKKEDNYKINPEEITKIYKKIRDVEKKITEINNILPNIKENQGRISNADMNINKLDQRLKDSNTAIEAVNKKFVDFSEDFEKIKVKVEDFNIYDIFKGDSSDGGGIDATKALIMSLENKIFKKFSLYDEKNKKNETDLFKALEEVKNIKNLAESLKLQNQRNNDRLNDNEKNLNEYKTKNDNRFDDIINNLDSLEEKIKYLKEDNKIKDEFEQKLKNLEDKLKNLIESSVVNNKTEKKSDDDGKNDKNNELMNKKLEEIESNFKDLRIYINDINKKNNQNLENINKILSERISALENNIQKKANLTDLGPINDKLYKLEEFIKEINANIDTMQLYSNKFFNELSEFNKKLEYIMGELSRLKSENEAKKDSIKEALDLSNLIDLKTFESLKKEINTKNEKMRSLIDEIFNNISDISTSLGLYSKTKDLTQFKNAITNLLDEFKSFCHKKYVEKHDINKNLKLIQTQIKSLEEAVKKVDNSENWLLAKKPLNNYQCASCEAMLKDLEKKDNYVAWNKYPNRDDKSYRMGHGFSRMLQMVNNDIIKSMENKSMKDNKGYASDEDKKYSPNNSKIRNKDPLDNKKLNLPKVSLKTTTNIDNLFENKYFSNSPYEERESYYENEPKLIKITKVPNNPEKRNLTIFNKGSLEINNPFNINEDNYTTRNKVKIVPTYTQTDEK